MEIGVPADIAYVPNDVIIALRKSCNWSRERLARQFELVGRQQGIATPGMAAMTKQIYRLETGRTRRPSGLYEELYSRTFRKSPAELFGSMGSSGGTAKTGVTVRSHKFIPVFVGPESASNLLTMCSPCAGQWTDCGRVEHGHPLGRCDLYVWRFGVALFHLVENLDLACVADLAVWRVNSYSANMKWAGSEVERLTGQPAGLPAYVLSMYWVSSHGWNERDLCNTLKLMCMPRVLLQKNCGDSARAHAIQIEKSLVRVGFDHPDLVDFGVLGSSQAFASWSGVVYHPIAPGRALDEQELVNCELSVQALWAYCEFIRRMVEQGKDPVVGRDFGWRFLRGTRSRLINERPQETIQHRSMREAVIRTSGLDRHLAQAVEILKEGDDA